MNKRFKAVSLGKVFGCYLLAAVFAVGLTAPGALAEKLPKECPPGQKEAICHVTTNQTIQLCKDDQEAIAEHMSHGDYLGECVTSPSG